VLSEWLEADTHSQCLSGCPYQSVGCVHAGLGAAHMTSMWCLCCLESQVIVATVLGCLQMFLVSGLLQALCFGREGIKKDVVGDT
jgi:hypothetical protein